MMVVVPSRFATPELLERLHLNRLLEMRQPASLAGEQGGNPVRYRTSATG